MSLRELCTEWFKSQNKSAETAVKNKWHKIAMVEGGTSQVFYLRYRFLEDISGRNVGAVAYKVILGYCVNSTGVLECRMWYYSGSEANWRAFTGYRTNGAWMKGAEWLDKKDVKRTYTSIGYINECYVTPKMHDALQGFWDEEQKKNGNPENTVSNTCPWESNPFDFALDKDEDVFRYLLGAKPAKDTPNKPAIGVLYDGEREFRLANLKTKSNEVVRLSKETGSVDIQNDYELSSNVQVRRAKLGHKFKKDVDLYDWIKGCLNQPISSVKKYHPVLNASYTIWSYTLTGCKDGGDLSDDLVVEIASTDLPQVHEYIDYSGKTQTISTPICWVRDVYYKTSPVTSFGTRKWIPANLSFLVQKPCDYLTQISDEYETRTNIKFQKDNKGKKELTDKSSVNVMGGGKYINLSMLNEATSPLVKSFKDAKNYPRFRAKYHVQNPNKKSALPMPLGLDLNGESVLLKMRIIQGIDEYLSIQLKVSKFGYQDDGSHGKDGVKRALELKSVIETCGTKDEICENMYRCFKDNKIGTFSGGWFSGIRTEATSLFTCICRNLLSGLALPFSNPAPKLKDGYDAKSKLPKESIDRMVSFITNTMIPDGCSDFMHITKQAPSLLTALKG